MARRLVTLSRVPLTVDIHKIKSLKLLLIVRCPISSVKASLNRHPILPMLPILRIRIRSPLEIMVLKNAGRNRSSTLSITTQINQHTSPQIPLKYVPLSTDIRLMPNIQSRILETDQQTLPSLIQNKHTASIETVIVTQTIRKTCRFWAMRGCWSSYVCWQFLCSCVVVALRLHELGIA